MTQQTSGYSAPAGYPDDSPTTHVARDQATDVGRTAGDAGRRVAGTAADQAGQVAQEARRQARDLLGEARGQANEQARNGQQKASESLRSLAAELHDMADGGDQHGPASDLAKQAAEKLGDAAEWIGRREPGEIIDEFRAMARRRPGLFLLGAAAAGVLAGRLTRGAVDANRESPSPAPGGSLGHPGVAVPTPAPPAPLDPALMGGPTPPTGFPTVAGDAAPRHELRSTGLPPTPGPTAPASNVEGFAPIWDEPGRPAPSARPETTVGEYVEEIERPRAPRNVEDHRDAGGPR